MKYTQTSAAISVIILAFLVSPAIAQTGSTATPRTLVSASPSKSLPGKRIGTESPATSQSTTRVTKTTPDGEALPEEHVKKFQAFDRESQRVMQRTRTDDALIEALRTEKQAAVERAETAEKQLKDLQDSESTLTQNVNAATADSTTKAARIAELESQLTTARSELTKEKRLRSEYETRLVQATEDLRQVGKLPPPDTKTAQNR